MSEAVRPLAGFRIAELYEPDCPLALRLAGGLAGRMLADLGAEVFIEVPAGGIAAVAAFLGAGKHRPPAGAGIGGVSEAAMA